RQLPLPTRLPPPLRPRRRLRPGEGRAPGPLAHGPGADAAAPRARSVPGGRGARAMRGKGQEVGGKGGRGGGRGSCRAAGAGQRLGRSLALPLAHSPTRRLPLTLSLACLLLAGCGRPETPSTPPAPAQRAAVAPAPRPPASANVPAPGG